MATLNSTWKLKWLKRQIKAMRKLEKEANEVGNEI